MPAGDRVMVSIDHANIIHERENKEGVRAYAKLAGRNWTYYVKALTVRIGRPPDPIRPKVEEDPSAGESGMLTAEDDSSLVHIDLGPSKLVSRQHATIEYTQNGPSNWQIIVQGRNGVKIDEFMLKRGTKKDLTSGMVLDIGGTQMMWVTPDEEPSVHPNIINKSREEQSNLREARQQLPSLAGRLTSSQGYTNAYGQGPALAPAPSDYNRHDSPGNTRGGNPKNSPVFRGGMSIESTEDIDYSLDSNRELKPPYSYATMIAQAILSAEDEKLTLNLIYQWIMEKYAFYRHSNSGWQVSSLSLPVGNVLFTNSGDKNSIRHNLSLNKAFEKIPRRTDEPGKGMKWQIVAAHREDYTKRAARPSKNAGQRTSSAPNSPLTREPLATAQYPTSGLPQPNFSFEGPRERGSLRPNTPPYGGAHDAQTPTRSLPQHPRGVNGTPPSATPTRPTNNPLLPGFGTSPPAFSSSYLDETSGAPLVTPAPRRHNPKLAPPSTAQKPSTVMPTTSSPAPFWQYFNEIPPSTPAQPNSSPVKQRATLANDSSPPVAARKELDKEPLHTSPPEAKPQVGAPKENGTGPADGLNNNAPPADDDDADMGGIDLARGFTSIGSFHSNLTNAAV